MLFKPLRQFGKADFGAFDLGPAQTAEPNAPIPVPDS
jgi:hypothetical protein